MNKKAQGLPINFIVIAALAILILILAAGFVIAGGSSVGGALGPQQARNTCNGYCSTSQQGAIAISDDEAIAAWKLSANLTEKFCTARLDIQGLGTSQACTDVVGACRVSFGDGQTYELNTLNCG